MTRLVLALWGAPTCTGPEALDFLRILAALAACDLPVRLVELPAAHGALDGDDLPDEVERILEALAAVGVRPEALPASRVDAELRGAAAVLRLGDPARSGAPGLLALTPPAGTDAAHLVEAGQVILG